MPPIKWIFLAVSLLAISGIARVDDDAAICSQYSGASDEERNATCTRILAAPGADRRSLSIAHVWKGKIFAKSHQFDAAFNEFQNAMTADPTNWEPYKERAVIKQSYKNDYSGALADYDEAITRNPTDFDVYRLRGDARILSGDYDNAVVDFDLALTHAKPGSEALLGRGRAKLAKRDYDGAIADFTEEIDKRTRFIFLALAQPCRAYTRKGNFAAGLADCNEAIRLGSQTPSSYEARGYAYIAQGDFDKAIADFNVALAKNANATTFYAGRAQAFEGKKDFDNARADYQIVATKLQPWASAEDRATQQTARLRLSALPLPRLDNALPSPARVALVIGNGAYRSVPTLPNPPKDANAVAKALEGVAFKVVQLGDDMPRGDFLRALRGFSHEAAKADWAVVYYAGHGMEIGGVNYLIPVDAVLAADSDAAKETVSLELVIAAVSGAKKLRLIMLDACRDNPFAAKMKRSLGLRLVDKGLSNIEPDAGIMVVYATRHGETAIDGDGDHSPFARAVIDDIAKPGIEVRRLFDIVRDDVMKATNRAQQPFSYGSLPGSQEFFFVSKSQ